MRLWAALHENGWETWIAERGDGTYAAWACPAAQNAGMVYVEDTFEQARMQSRRSRKLSTQFSDMRDVTDTRGRASCVQEQ